MNTTTYNNYNKQKGINNIKIVNADVLKIIAIVTMLIDHIGAAFLLYIIRYSMYPDSIATETMHSLYYNSRHIGRIAFPIFCFLLVEGYTHTHSKIKYLRNLTIFAVLSELPFDLAFRIDDTPFELNIFSAISSNITSVLELQNVYITLALGLIAIWAADTIYTRLTIRPVFSPYQKGFFEATVLSGVVAVIIGYIAKFLHTDYSYHGIILIVIFMICRDYPIIGCITGYLAMCYKESEIYCLPAFIFILLYNGKRGSFSKKHKYIFYVFYPLHLILLYLIRSILAL